MKRKAGSGIFLRKKTTTRRTKVILNCPGTKNKIKFEIMAYSFEIKKENLNSQKFRF